MEKGERPLYAGLTLVQMPARTYVKMKVNWSHTMVAYFCKLKKQEIEKTLIFFGQNDMTFGISKVR